MKFYFHEDIDTEFLQREAFMDLYIKKMKEVIKLKKQISKHSKTQGKALETYAGARSNSNHKNDMAIMQKNTQIKTLKKEIEYIDSIFNFNYFKENNLLYNKYYKTIDSYLEVI